ncbi:MAG: integrase [Nonlabens sp.]|jgi:integrase
MSVKRNTIGYIIDFTLNGTRYRERIGPPHNKSAEKRLQSQEALYKMLISIDDKSSLKRFPNSKIIQKAFKCEKPEYTVHQYSNIWFRGHLRTWSHTTIRGYTQKYNTHIKTNFGDMSLTDFTSSTYHDWAIRQSMSGKSMNDIRNILSQIFQEAFFDSIIEANPIKRTRPAKRLQKEPEPFNLGEINSILETLPSPYKEYFIVAFYTGMRTGELLALRWQDVDLDKDKIFVRRSISHGVEKEPKTKGSIRNMDMSTLAKHALTSIQNSKWFDSYRIFTDPKTSKTYRNAEGIRKYIWKPALERVSVKYRCPYQTRHSYASMMLSRGENPMWVASQMGHSDWGMIRKVYGRWIP